MNLPLIGTVDLSPSGLFLVFAILVAAGYLTWQVVDARKKTRAQSPEGPSPIEADADGDRSGEDGGPQAP